MTQPIAIPIRQQDGSVVTIRVKPTDGMQRLAAWVAVRERTEAPQHQQALLSLADALADDVMAASDNQILEELVQDGVDLEHLVQDMRGLFRLTEATL